ncbi:hypothetical protein Ae201684_014846 [Aphanomyces euteiches]|uniref:Protein kinase domain-containing protein n=1 Tax=Aphanomyces euteiches TaxID=100861 RepID=A0A6G0WIP8_9STRA|nr:hypothetical protein Ae201684_014846 [Aphanomyces euteiches]
MASSSNANRYGYGNTSGFANSLFQPPSGSQERTYTSPVKSSGATPRTMWTPPRHSGATRSTTSAGVSSPISSELTSSAPPFIPQQQLVSEPLVQVTRGGCIFYVPESEVATGSLHVEVPLATTPSSTSSPIVATRRSLASLALAPSIRRQLDAQHEEMVRQIDPSDERYKEIPSQFTCMWPLDHDTVHHRNVAGSFGYPSHSYKVLSETDGRTYALRRIENVRTTPAIVQQAVETWKRIVHSSLVPLHRAFVSHGALFFLCEFYPGAVSLHQKYIAASAAPSEAFLWTLLTQLSGALRVVHAAQLACKAIHARRILVTAHDRIRITGLGVLDVLEYDSLKSKPRVESLQREDVWNVGKVLYAVASRREWHASNQLQGLTDMRSIYSSTLCQIVENLLDQTISNVQELSQPLHDHLFDELDTQARLADECEHQLASEYQNGRMLLLLMKLGLVNERPELYQDPSWAETGDRYLLQLFRDYVFHQVDEMNRPVVDFGHVVDCLNKLDSASPEKILLSSRDGQSILVASYAEVHRCVQQTFSDLLTAAQRRPVHVTPVAKSIPMRGRGGGRASRGGGRGRSGRT